MFMLTGESFLVNQQRKQQFHLKSPILVLSQIKLDHLAMWGFIPTGFWQGESQQTFFVAVPTNRSTFLKVQQNLGIFLSIPKNISIFSGATFFYWFFWISKFSVQESLAFGLHRGGRVLLGDEMGLGKTLQVREDF